MPYGLHYCQCLGCDNDYCNAYVQCMRRNPYYVPRYPASKTCDTRLKSRTRIDEVLCVHCSSSQRALLQGDQEAVPCQVDIIEIILPGPDGRVLRTGQDGRDLRAVRVQRAADDQARNTGGGAGSSSLVTALHLDPPCPLVANKAPAPSPSWAQAQGGGGAPAIAAGNNHPGGASPDELLALRRNLTDLAAGMATLEARVATLEAGAQSSPVVQAQATAPSGWLGTTRRR